MGKKKKPLGVKRKRGKNFVWKGDSDQPIKHLKPVKNKDTANIFRDKRLGEKNPNMDLEQKYLIRFQRERAFLARKKNKFELEDMDDLAFTHRGVPIDDLSDREVNDYASSDSEAEPHKKVKLSDDIVEEMHFGSGGQKSRQDIYNELIANSKYQKYMRQKEKEEAQETIRQLDSDLTDITNLLKFKEKKPAQEDDEFDDLINEIRNASDRRPAYVEKIQSDEEGEQVQVNEEKERVLNRDFELVFLFCKLESFDEFYSLIELCEIFYNRTMKPYTLFYPQWIRALERILQKCEKQNELLMSGENDIEENWEQVYMKAADLLKEFISDFKNSAGTMLAQHVLNQYLSSLDQVEVNQDTIQAEPIKQFKINEIPTYEPLIVKRINTKNKSKDMNKEATERDKLKQQVKKAKKLAKRALHEETQAIVQNKTQEQKLRSDHATQDKKRTARVMDELEADYKKLVTSQGEKRKQKRKGSRMAGNKMAQAK